MFRYIVILLLSIEVLTCKAQTQISTQNLTNKVLVAAHRGDWRNEPENSLRGFLSAAKMGVDIVELDLKITKDKQLVVMHDNTINRTTDGKGKPEEYTLKEIKKFKLRNGLGRPSSFNHIPTFREVMMALKGKSVKVNLDKSYPYWNEAYQVLQQTGTLEQAIFKSEMPYDSLVQRYPKLIGKIVYMPVIFLDKPDAKRWISNYLKHMNVYAFELVFSSDTSATLRDSRFMRNSGFKIWINSLWSSLNGGHDDDLAVDLGNTKDSWGWLIRHGATIIQTDRPKELLQYLRQKKLHR